MSTIKEQTRNTRILYAIENSPYLIIRLFKSEDAWYTLFGIVTLGLFFTLFDSPESRANFFLFIKAIIQVTMVVYFLLLTIYVILYPFVYMWYFLTLPPEQHANS